MTKQTDLFPAPEVLPAIQPARERVIEFGKYRNQPYEVLLGDASYALWLLSSMFAKLQEQHPALLAFLVNRFGLPDRTPEHNRLQNRFLDSSFAIRFALCASPTIQRWVAGLPIDAKAAWGRTVRSLLTREHEHLERMQHFSFSKQKPADGVRDVLLAQAEQLAFVANTGSYADGCWADALTVTQMQFEQDGADVAYAVESHGALMAPRIPATGSLGASTPSEEELECIASFGARDSFRIEVKPVVGDDYPAILRAMKAVKGTHLLVGEYTGAGATWDEVVRVFGLSHIAAVKLSDVEQMQLRIVLDGVKVARLSSSDAQRIVLEEYAALSAAT